MLLIHATQLVPVGHPLRAAAAHVDDACRFAVPLFIGVLGFWCGGLVDRPVDWGPFYRDRARRLLPAYLLWGVAYLYSPGVPGFGPAAGAPVTGVLLGFVETHLYFVVAYVGLLGVFPLLRALLRALPTARVPLLLLVPVLHLGWLVAVERDLAGGGDGGLYVATAWRLPVHWMGFFCLGLLASLLRERLVVGSRPLLVAAPLLAAAHLGLTLRADPRIFFGYTAGFFGVALTGGALAYLLARLIAGTTAERGIAWMGRSSFSIFLSHVLWLKLAFLALGGVATPATLVGATGCMFACSVAYAWVAEDRRG